MTEPSNTNRYRWLPRFRLRTLLILMCVVGAALGLGGNFWRRLQQQRRAIALVEGAGGKIIFAHEFGHYDDSEEIIEYRHTRYENSESGVSMRTRLSTSLGTVVDYETPPGPAILRRFLGDRAFATADTVYFHWDWDSQSTELDPEVLQAFPELRMAWFSGSQVSDAWLRAVVRRPQLRGLYLNAESTTEPVNLSILAAAPQLNLLSLSGDWLRDDSLRAVGQLRQLKSLNISRSPNITAAALQHLNQLDDLTMLSILKAPGFDDQGNPDFASLPQLRRLILIDTPIGDRGLASIARLKRLEYLDLSWTKVGDAGVAQLAGLRALRFLNLRNTNVGDAGIQSIEPLQELRILVLDRTPITPASLLAISKLRKLELLNLQLLSWKVTEEQLLQLRSLTKLKRLAIGPVTPEGSVALQKALPNCDIAAWDQAGIQLSPP